MAWTAGSTAVQHWDEDDAMEEMAHAELVGLLQRIARLDPPARSRGRLLSRLLSVWTDDGVQPTARGGDHE
jgi:hypothetical protein